MVSTRRAAMVVGVVLLGVLLGWLLVSTLDDDSGGAGSGAGAATSAADATAGASASGSPGPGAVGAAGGGDGQAEEQTTGPSGTASPGAAPGASPGASNGPPEGGTVVEHRPADAEETRRPLPGEKGFRLPGLRHGEPPEYLVDQAPEPDRAEGAVVAGYPVAYLPLPRRAGVVASEVASEGTRVQAFLQATCDCSVAAVVGFHDKALAELGMVGKPAPATGAGTARSYGDENDSITLTVRRDGGTVAYTLFSVITAARA